jgi:hypothetical protein
MLGHNFTIGDLTFKDLRQAYLDYFAGIKDQNVA